MLSLLLLILLLVFAHFTTPRGGGPSRGQRSPPVGGIKKTPPTPFLTHVRLMNACRGGRENGDTRPAAPFFFSYSSPGLHSLNYKAQNGSLVLPQSFVAFSFLFLMINNRETLAVVAMEFSLKREFRKIQCPLFLFLSLLSLSLSLTHLSYIYTYLYVYIYILFFAWCVTL